MSNTLDTSEEKRKLAEDVKSLIVGTGVHLRLKNYCKENGFTIRPFVERIIAEALDQRDLRK